MDSMENSDVSCYGVTLQISNEMEHILMLKLCFFYFFYIPQTSDNWIAGSP